MAKTIQIAPYLKDCTITEHQIIGIMDGKKYIFTLPEGYEFDLEASREYIRAFQQAIALASKTWQAEGALNDAFGIKGGRFTVE